MKVTTTKIEVRYAETDQMAVVYHTNYLVWMEIGRTNFAEEHLGLRYADMEAAGFLLPVIDVQVSYMKPLLYGQTALVKTKIATYDGIRITYVYDIYEQETQHLAVSGKTTHVCVRKKGFKPIALRNELPNWDKAYWKATERK